MAWLDKLHHPEKFIKTFLKWGLLGLIMGILGGLIGAGFHHALHFVTHVRGEHTWLIFLLPLGGLFTVALYKFLKLQNNKGTSYSAMRKALLDMSVPDCAERLCAIMENLIKK